MIYSTVAYRETRTFGSYQNVTVEISAVLGQDENAAEAFETVKAKVQEKLTERIADDEFRREVEIERSNLEYKLRDLRSDIESAQKRWGEIEKFMAKFGVTDFGEIPF